MKGPVDGGKWNSLPEFADPDGTCTWVTLSLGELSDRIAGEMAYCDLGISAPCETSWVI